jgi:alkylated DNA nucleotide flippase Atl1
VESSEHARERGIERMLVVVESIPVGHVLTYGDVAALAGYGGPRTAGQAMAHYGSAVPWHRVVTADGRPPAHAAALALERLRADGVPLTADGGRVRMSSARWAPPADRFDELIGE